MLSDNIFGLSLEAAARLTYEFLYALDAVTLASELDEIETAKLILIAKNRGKGFHMKAEDDNYRDMFLAELTDIMDEPGSSA